MKLPASTYLNTDQLFNILVIDPNNNLGSMLQEHLRDEKYRVDLCNQITQVDDFCRTNKYVACIIDLQAPVNDYFKLALEIKTINDRISVIYLGKDSTKEEIVAAYHHAADDFIRKPISPEEINARLFAILKRTCNIKEASTSCYKFGEFTFDLQTQILSIRDKKTRLTTKEYEMLKLLCQNANELVDRSLILKAIWKNDSYFNARSMDVYITKLRHLLKDDPTVCIVNAHGKGYRLATHETQS